MLACVSPAEVVAQPQQPPPVTAKWRVVAVDPVRGATELAFDVEVPSGWHVNAHQPTQPFLIPTVLTVEPPTDTAVGEIRYPDPVERVLEFAGATPLRLYEGTFAIPLRVTGKRDGELTGRLRYQACSDDTCLPPKTLSATTQLRAEERAGASGALAPRLGGESPFERWMRDRGFLATLGLAALFGLALNLTPCVYPLISVTIAYFGGQSRASSRRVLLLAVAYVIGIAASFSALGVTAALSGGLFGAALQSPLVLGAIALVLVGLAASNFGLYQFRMPAVLTQRAGRASAGVAGALAMGLTMGIVAAPCVGPIIIALLLFVAARQDAFLGFVLFFALALGMGAPYVVLAAAAGSIQRLPRSGEWLAWIEHLFGFMLLGLALYFLGPLIGDTALRVGGALLVAFAGVYLGFLDPAGRSLRSFVHVRRTVGVAGLAVAVWLAMPRQAESMVAWQPFTPAALAAATREGKPAIVDFTASWCLPCRENDRYTFTDPGVGAEATRFTMLRADVTEMTEETEQWMADFQVLGVPTIVFYRSDGVEATRVVGFVPPEKMVELMREVG
jgi:thioredoxin:protein disulfide reductase